MCVIQIGFKQGTTYVWKKPLTQYHILSITFICRLCTMLFSWILLVILVGIYAINNNKSVHSKSTTIVPKTKRILRNYPKQMDLKAVDKFKQNIISKQKGLEMSSNQGIMMLFIICYFLFLKHNIFRKPHLFWWIVKLPPEFN